MNTTIIQWAIRNARPATEAELKEQGENLAKNYKPGPRQAVPFLPDCKPCRGSGRHIAGCDCPNCGGTGKAECLA